MPFEIVRSDITNMKVDAIVNAASRYPRVNAGVDSAIHKKAGPALLEARKTIGCIEPGSAAITPAFGLDSKFVIHAAIPAWCGGLRKEALLLRKAYDRCLDLALENNCHSIAFPLLASGSHGFPKDRALQIAISAFSDFLLKHEMLICLVVFDRQAFRLSKKLFRDVASYIDQNYLEGLEQTIYAAREPRCDRRRYMDVCEGAIPEDRASCPPIAASKAMSLEQMLAQADAGFTETLLKLIDKRGKKDSEIYKKANISKQHFSKIRNNPDYKPTKPTAIALALALELDLEATKDLIGRAGYTLTNSSKFDLIIRYFIEQHKFNIVEINLALYEFDQPLLGV